MIYCVGNNSLSLQVQLFTNTERSHFRHLQCNSINSSTLKIFQLGLLNKKKNALSPRQFFSFCAFKAKSLSVLLLVIIHLGCRSISTDQHSFYIFRHGLIYWTCVLETSGYCVCVRGVDYVLTCGLIAAATQVKVWTQVTVVLFCLSAHLHTAVDFVTCKTHGHLNRSASYYTCHCSCRAWQGAEHVSSSWSQLPWDPATPVAFALRRSKMQDEAP